MGAAYFNMLPPSNCAKLLGQCTLFRISEKLKSGFSMSVSRQTADMELTQCLIAICTA